jgi:hypothetical protein
VNDGGGEENGLIGQETTTGHFRNGGGYDEYRGQATPLDPAENCTSGND